MVLLYTGAAGLSRLGGVADGQRARCSGHGVVQGGAGFFQGSAGRNKGRGHPLPGGDQGHPRRVSPDVLGGHGAFGFGQGLFPAGQAHRLGNGADGFPRRAEARGLGRRGGNGPGVQGQQGPQAISVSKP